MLKNTFRASFVLALLALAGCNAASTPPFEGTFTGINITPLPSPPLPPGDLEIDATLVLRDATHHYDLDMHLSSMGLEDDILLEGDYDATAGTLELVTVGFDAATTDTTSTMEGGVVCVTLNGFVDTPVCFAPHTSAYAEAGGEPTFTLEHVIAGEPGSTAMTLARQP